MTPHVIKDTHMWHMMGVNPIMYDWLEFDIIFGVNVISKYYITKKTGTVIYLTIWV